VAIKIQHCIRTLRLKVKAEGYAWLNAAAIEVNQVWNYANATSNKAARPSLPPNVGATSGKPSVYTAPPQGEGKTPCTNSQGRS
jgi:hypothetical protein